jgi:hypothetical protein
MKAWLERERARARRESACLDRQARTAGARFERGVRCDHRLRGLAGRAGAARREHCFLDRHAGGDEGRAGRGCAGAAACLPPPPSVAGRGLSDAVSTWICLYTGAMPQGRPTTAEAEAAPWACAGSASFRVRPAGNVEGGDSSSGEREREREREEGELFGSALTGRQRRESRAEDERWLSRAFLAASAIRFSSERTSASARGSRQAAANSRPPMVRHSSS